MPCRWIHVGSFSIPDIGLSGGTKDTIIGLCWASVTFLMRYQGFHRCKSSECLIVRETRLVQCFPSQGLRPLAYSRSILQHEERIETLQQ